jgi:hypothetical protein
MGLFDNFFGQQAAPAAPVPAPAQQAAAPVAGTNANGIAQQLPATGAPAAFQPSTTQNPLDTFSDLFKATPQTEHIPGLDDPFITLDTEAVNGIVSKETFTNQPDFAVTAQKALQGDVQAFMDVLNGVARGVFQRNATLTAMVADRAAREGVNRLNSQIPNVIRNTQTNAALVELNPVFNHAGAKPIVDMFTQQLQLKNPTMTPQQLAEQTVKYFNSLVPQAPAPQQTSQSPFGNAQQNFEGFFN